MDKPNSDQLVIALEPEAASLHCRHLPDTDFVGYKDNVISKPTFEPGTKYLVVDAGGKRAIGNTLSTCTLKRLRRR